MSNNNETKKNDETENNTNSFLDSCLGICLLVFATIGVCGIIAAIVFHVYLSITGLAGVSNEDIRTLCNSSAINATSGYTYIGENPSEIWMYVLMSLIFVSGGLASTAKNANDPQEAPSVTSFMCALNCQSILYGVFCGWGYDQIWNSGTCLEHNFGNEKLMISAHIHFWIQAVMCGIISFINIIMIISFIVPIMCNSCCNKDQSDSQKVATSDPDIRLRQIITGEGKVINSDKKHVYGVPATDRATV